MVFVRRKIRMAEEWQKQIQRWKICYIRKGNIKGRVYPLALTYPCGLWKFRQSLLLSRTGKLWILGSINVINIILPENLAKEWIRKVDICSKKRWPFRGLQSVPHSSLITTNATQSKTSSQNKVYIPTEP